MGRRNLGFDELKHFAKLVEDCDSRQELKQRLNGLRMGCINKKKFRRARLIKNLVEEFK